eukprot:Phypoly_transcript_03649.p1 GENE.Phypoly_transcript_03649~~Phypoly_transcript_03649.p1  ORF type:complete len:762 (+),score=117.08 Phypoly_transcript_03649:31-2286(+)
MAAQTPSQPLPSIKSIYFYGEVKSGGDAPVKQMYIVTPKHPGVPNTGKDSSVDEDSNTMDDKPREIDNKIANGDTNTESNTTNENGKNNSDQNTDNNSESNGQTNVDSTSNSTSADLSTASVPDEKGKKRPNEKPTGKKAKKQRVAFQSGICLKVASGEVCPYGEKCKYSHDPKTFLDSKEPDLGDTCYMFSTYGYCPYGLSCRYGSAHIKDFKHITNQELFAKMGKPPIINAIKKETQVALRRDRRDYPKSAPLVKKYAQLQQGTQAPPVTIPHSASVLLSKSITTTTSTATTTSTTTNSTTTTPTTVAPTSTPTPTTLTPATPTPTPTTPTPTTSTSTPTTSTPTLATPTATPTPATTSTSISTDATVPAKTVISFPPELDVETRLRPAEKKQVDFKGKLYLAPLTTNGNLPFRRICKGLGADITCGEMALASNLLKGQASEWALLRRHPSEDVFGIQVCGAFVDQMTHCAELIEQEDLNVDFVDINSGCPIDIICNKGMGSALLDKPRRIEGILRSMSEVLTRPLTIKIRTGRDDKSSTAHKLIPNLKLWGADAVTLHGRTRVQRYSKVADWDYINTCSQISPIPLIGNGDVYNWQEAVHYLENTSISSIMIARSAIIKPWIFTEIKERRDWDISATERLDMLKNFSNYGLEHWGSDTQGVEKTRNFLLNWISFLCRYVPVGLLERLPSRINERPPNFYYGRSDLETLLASRKVSDWVKISEMLLGPVPSDFHFEPKHKSNSYEDAQG